MKSHITVLLYNSSLGIKDNLNKILEPHRLDENTSESIQAHHWDYWFFPEKDNLNDNDLRLKFPKESEEVLRNSAFIKNLPEDYSTSGIIGKNGVWIDLQDYGWKMINEPSESNNIAMEKWRQKVKETFAENRDTMCIQIIIHC